jgi:hypothetical protein
MELFPSSTSLSTSSPLDFSLLDEDSPSPGVNLKQESVFFRDICVSKVLSSLYPFEDTHLDLADRLAITAVISEFIPDSISLSEALHDADSIIEKYICTPKVLRSLVSRLSSDNATTEAYRLRVLKTLIYRCPHISFKLSQYLEEAVVQFCEGEKEAYLGEEELIESDLLVAESDCEIPSNRLRNTTVQHDPTAPSHHAILLAALVESSKIFIHGKEGLSEDARMSSVVIMREATLGEELHTLTRIFTTMCKCRDALGKNFIVLEACGGALVRLHPNVAPTLFQKLLRLWPKSSSRKEGYFLQLMERLLLSTPTVLLSHVSIQTLMVHVFKELTKVLRSSHLSNVKAALQLVSNSFIVTHYVVPINEIRNTVRDSLKYNAVNHWNGLIKSASIVQYDRLIEFENYPSR